MYQLGLPREAPILINVGVDNQTIEMEVDTGAPVTVLSEDLFCSKFTQHEIKPVNAHLRTYSGELIKPIGVAEVTAAYNDQKESLPLVITPITTLLGRN